MPYLTPEERDAIEREALRRDDERQKRGEVYDSVLLRWVLPSESREAINAERLELLRAALSRAREQLELAERLVNLELESPGKGAWRRP